MRMKHALITAFERLTEQQSAYIYEALADWLEQHREAIESLDDIPEQWHDRAEAVGTLTDAGDAARGQL